ncbi:hypothetical protein T440DRAFT_477792 [Plenodomus tracheiphilus IPT5]|uniref:Uncharacterized protein n=1 Tax=Plenodomus tracheiphilus IPT5 TaxID=1408161 RepID=A0A6A7B9Z5_9PLEO|nr:hypothetical protein T440DRAFT_477792 [Plenodomus tracheiphilus IPT5]
MSTTVPLQTLVSSSPSPSMTSIIATRIFINQLSDYGILSTCAEQQISTIVRDMSYGCGDGSRTTSFACFCYTSSTQFDSMIGAHVRTACPNDAAEEMKARDLFHEYCEIPITAGFSGGQIPVKTTSSEIVSSFSSAQSSSSTNPTKTSTISQSASTSSPPSASTIPAADTGDPRSTIIALSVTLPLLALLIAIGIFLYLHRSKNSKDDDTAATTAPTKQEEELETSTESSQEAAEIYTHPTELPEREKAPYHAVELPVDHKGVRGVAELEGGS